MAFADLEELEDRLDFDLDEAMTRMALAALEDASDMARTYGAVNWPDNRVPRIVRTIVLNVVARYMRNPDGFVTSRAGDETVAWSDLRGESTLRFSDEEQKLLRTITRPSTGLTSIPVYAWNPGRSGGYPAGYVPVGPGPGPDFPFFAEREVVGY